MPQRDIEKLLGGYATDTLTEEERKELFAAALRDQSLFNALAEGEVRIGDAASQNRPSAA